MIVIILILITAIGVGIALGVRSLNRSLGPPYNGRMSPQRYSGGGCGD